MFKKKLAKQLISCAVVLLIVFGAQSVFGQTTEFTYQGKLSVGGNPATANYDMQFRLFDMAGAGQGTQQGSTITNPIVVVTNGNFAVPLDFGAAVFASGSDRFLEISIRPAGNMGGYTSLAPRQKLTSSPYSVRSANANSADTLSSACVGCVQNLNINSIDGNKVTGTVANSTNAVNATTATSAATATTATTAGNVSGVVAIENGGTGSATQNFIDLTTDQTIDGNKAFNGTVSAGALSGDGSGLTNLFSIYTFGGIMGDIPGGGVLAFPNPVGTTTIITVNGNQRMTGTATAVMGFSINGTTTNISINLCYQDINAGPLVPFSSLYLRPQVSWHRTAFTVSKSTVPPAGTFRVGFCTVYNADQITDVENVAGWVMVTNN